MQKKRIRLFFPPVATAKRFALVFRTALQPKRKFLIGRFCLDYRLNPPRLKFRTHTQQTESSRLSSKPGTAKLSPAGFPQLCTIKLKSNLLSPKPYIGKLSPAGFAQSLIQWGRTGQTETNKNKIFKKSGRLTALLPSARLFYIFRLYPACSNWLL